MISDGWKSVVAASVFGADRSSLMPARLRVGWYNSSGTLLGLAGGSIPSEVFEESGDGVVNTALVDGGVAGAGWVIASVGLHTLDGDLIITAPLSSPVSPATDEALVFGPGMLVVEVA